MCFVSAVHEQYKPWVPSPDQTQQRWNWPQPGIPQKDLEDLRELIDSFRDAVRAAEVFDRLTGQPDCVDPEKAALEDRVAELERRLDEMAAASR